MYVFVVFDFRALTCIIKWFLGIDESVNFFINSWGRETTVSCFSTVSVFCVWCNGTSFHEFFLRTLSATSDFLSAQVLSPRIITFFLSGNFLSSLFWFHWQISFYSHQFYKWMSFTNESTTYAWRFDNFFLFFLFIVAVGVRDDGKLDVKIFADQHIWL